MRIGNKGILVLASVLSLAARYCGLTPDAMSAARKAALRTWVPDRF
jgi:hypothetical protein